MTTHPIKVKLKVNPELDSSLRRLSGCYRKIFNLCMDAQEFRVVYNTPENHFMSGSKLLEVIKLKDFPFLKEIDKGILTAAVNAASSDFLLNFNYSLKSIHHLSRKKSRMKFKTNGNVRVHDEYIEIPKLGKIYLTEKGRIPLNISPTKLTFVHDGVDWFIVALVEKVTKPETLSDNIVSLDFSSSGNILINGKVIQSIVDSEDYIEIEKKLKRTKNKLKRQIKANSISKFGKDIPVTTKNIQRTKRTLDKVKNVLYNSRKNNFNKIVKEVAITKPKELHILSNILIKQKRHKYSTRKHKRQGSYEFMKMLKERLELMGTKVIRHSSIESFQQALDCRD